MYDLIIVGGGVAGCRLASRLDLDTLLLEKSKEITLKDSGIVSQRFLDMFGTDLVEHKINAMEAVSPSGKTFRLSSETPFAYIIDRVGFSRFLRKEAGKKANVRYEFAEKVVYEKDSVSVITDKEEHKARMVVGCDGALSSVRKCAGITPPDMYPGILMKTKEKITGENIQVFFNKFFSPEFFSWIIPQNNEYGLITGIRPREHLDYFRKKQNLPGGWLHSHVIPAGSTQSYAERTILAGDACGQTKPLTGGGIIFSLRACQHAENTINEAFMQNNFSKEFLGRYEEAWKREMSPEIQKQLIARRFYRKMSNSDIETAFGDFGKSIEAMRGFDYDHLSGIWKKLPLFKLARFAFSRMHYLF